MKARYLFINLSLKPAHIVLFLFVTVLSVNQIAHAKISEGYLKRLINNAVRSDKLYLEQDWLNLLHYRKNTFSIHYTSEIDGDGFFTSPYGRTSPRAELVATIRAMHTLYFDENSKHPQCLFPARLTWLRKNIDNFNSELPDIDCEPFLKWRHFFNPESVSIVFVTPNIDPSSTDSIFGETFLKINPPEIRSELVNKGYNSLPAKTISYNIDASQSQKAQWLYRYNAATGHFLGQFTIEPYRDRLARFSNIDNRDTWEYRLNLRPLETERLLEHVWELIQTDMNYFSIDENSAYILLTLIDAARSDLELAEEFSLQILPIDIISLLIDKEIITDIQYKPSKFTNLKYHIDEYDGTRQVLINGLIDGSKTTADPEFKALAETVKVFIIEIASEYLQLAFDKGEVDRIAFRIRTKRLFDARKKLDPLIELADAPPPSGRPDQGHNSSRLVTAVGQSAHENYFELTWRPALHDLLDSNGPYPAGTQINYFDTAVRWGENSSVTELQRLHFVNLYSLEPRSDVYQPWSYKFKIGFDRKSIFSHFDNLYFNVNGAVGVTYQPFKSFHFYALAELTSIFDKRFDSTASFGAGPNFGILWQINQKWKIWIDSSTQFYDQQNTNNIVEDHSINQSYALYNKSLRLTVAQQGLRSETHIESNISLTWYY